MGALKAGSRMRWMDMYTADEAHVDPAALLILRTEADVSALRPLVRRGRFSSSLHPLYPVSVIGVVRTRTKSGHRPSRLDSRLMCVK